MTSDLLDRVRRMPMGLDVVVSGPAPARLPGEGRLGAGVHRLIGRGTGEYLFVGVRGNGAAGTAAARPAGPAGPGGPGGPGALRGAVASGAPGVRAPRDVFLDPGDICFYDADRPPVPVFPEPSRLKVFLVPRESLGIDERDVRQVMATPVARTSRLGTLLSPFLSELADMASASRPSVGEMLAWNAVNLLATLATEQLGRDATGIPDAQSPLLSRILTFIEAHLADADLCPETIAAAQHISVRYLHKLFQDEGTTVGRWIQRRRLEECRRDLLLHVRGRQTIAAVAGRWGFLSATHFSRVFRAAYGMSPSQWRDTAGRGCAVG
ncbi:helix-turn-helix domain-containing protein [Streptomyces cavernae]|uniref:helix-turn-helix domain-containing protein n=1 Tax=Streptomyces cavernae TaxID=2259034 RepID=UPI00192E6C7F|nr:helix-turn-helix domain-containing protein [Streptomyces cavernae]